jgi:hypothetical protein
MLKLASIENNLGATMDMPSLVLFRVASWII